MVERNWIDAVVTSLPDVPDGVQLVHNDGLSTAEALPALIEGIRAMNWHPPSAFDRIVDNRRNTILFFVLRFLFVNGAEEAKSSPGRDSAFVQWATRDIPELVGHPPRSLPGPIGAAP